MKRRRAAGLLTATLAMTAAIWAWWLLDPTAPQGPALPAALSAALAANVALTLTSVRLKRAVVAPYQRRTFPAAARPSGCAFRCMVPYFLRRPGRTNHATGASR